VYVNRQFSNVCNWQYMQWDLVKLHRVALGFYNYILSKLVCMFLARQSPPIGPGHPHSRGFYITHNDAPHSVGFLWTSDQLVAETSTWQHTPLTTETSTPPVGFEPKISAGERPQTYDLDCAATGTGWAN